MPLYIDYCKEIQKELGKVAVYMPGEEVNVGDVINFTLDKRHPIGPFQRFTRLSNLGVAFATLPPTKNPQPYIYSSNGKVSFDLNGSLAVDPVADTKLSVSFSHTGAIYLCAAGCTEVRMDDIPNVGMLLRKHADSLDWGDYFLVTGVTMAKKALIMQSGSTGALLEVEGNTKNFQTGGTVSIRAAANLKVTRCKDAAFIKDWSRDVTVFFSLARFEKKLFHRFPELKGGDMNYLGYQTAIPPLQVGESYLEYTLVEYEVPK